MATVENHGWFEKGGAVRRATSPAHAVKLRSEGWVPSASPAESEPTPALLTQGEFVVNPNATSLDLPTVETDDADADQKDDTDA